MKMRRLRQKLNKKGVTLIELLAVVVIIALTTAIAYPNIGRRIERNRIEQYKQSCITMVEFAEMHVKTINSRIYEYDYNGEPYLVYVPADEDGNASSNTAKDTEKFRQLRNALIAAKTAGNYDVRIYTLKANNTFNMMIKDQPADAYTKGRTYAETDTLILCIYGNSIDDNPTENKYKYKVYGAWYFVKGATTPTYTYSAITLDGMAGGYTLTDDGLV